MRREHAVIILLLLLLASSSALAYFHYSLSLELQGELSEARGELEVLRRSLDEARRELSEAQEMLSEAKRDLLEEMERTSHLRESISRLQENLSLCMEELSRISNISGSLEEYSREVEACESELSACRSMLHLLERASVQVVHWWYDSAGCAPCGTASARFHVILFNAGRETAHDVRLTIVLYDGSNNPIGTFGVDVGTIPGRTGRVIERTLALPPGFKGADVRCYWG